MHIHNNVIHVLNSNIDNYLIILMEEQTIKAVMKGMY